MKLQDNRGYDNLTEEEKYTVIAKAMQSKQDGLEDRTIPLKYVSVNGGSYQKQYLHLPDTKKIEKCLERVEDEDYAL